METPTPTPLRTVAPYGGLALGVASVSVAAILIRLADTEPLTVAAYRMGIAALVVSTFTLATAHGQLRRLTATDMPWLLLGGAFLAAHFAAFIASLEYTTVASSVLLVTVTPVFVVVGSQWGLRERIGTTVALAVLLSLMGGVVMAVGDWRGDDARLLGDGLALLGALAAAGYLLVGRRVRGRVPLLSYITVVYSTAAVLLVSSALAAGSPLSGHPFDAYAWMLLLALIPQVIGHSALNWALARFSATVVSLSIRVEPLVAIGLAVVVLSEVPPWTVIPGGLMVLAGVYLAVGSKQDSALHP